MLMRQSRVLCCAVLCYASLLSCSGSSHLAPAAAPRIKPSLAASTLAQLQLPLCMFICIAAGVLLFGFLTFHTHTFRLLCHTLTDACWHAYCDTPSPTFHCASKTWPVAERCALLLVLRD